MQAARTDSDSVWLLPYQLGEMVRVHLPNFASSAGDQICQETSVLEFELAQAGCDVCTCQSLCSQICGYRRPDPAAT